jgi:hypothetical protein
MIERNGRVPVPRWEMKNIWVTISAKDVQISEKVSINLSQIPNWTDFIAQNAT